MKNIGLNNKENVIHWLIIWDDAGAFSLFKWNWTLRVFFLFAERIEYFYFNYIELYVR